MSSNSVCYQTNQTPAARSSNLLTLVWLQPELDDTKSYYHYYTLTSIHVVLLCSEQPKTVDDASVKLDRGKLSIESSLESVAEAMLDPG